MKPAGGPVELKKTVSFELVPRAPGLLYMAQSART
jgi:hypothetical protein